MNKQYEYTAELQLNDGSIIPIDLEERGWAEPKRLAATRVFTLVPKDITSKWPLIRIHIPDGAKPIFKSRNNVNLIGHGRPMFRAYAAGWHKRGINHWTWVFPNGAIETETDDPSFNNILVKAINDAWRASLPQEQVDGG